MNRRTDRCETYKLVDSTSYAALSGLRVVKYVALRLKHVEHFEDDDDNNNDSDDVEDVSVHGSWITPRYPGGKQFGRRNGEFSLSWNSIGAFRRTELRCGLSAGYLLEAALWTTDNVSCER